VILPALLALAFGAPTAAESRCVNLDLTAQPACWQQLADTSPWNPHALDWHGRLLELARLRGDRPAERATQRVVLYMHGPGSAWFNAQDEALRGTARIAVDGERARLVPDSPDLAALGIDPVPADPVGWAAARRTLEAVAEPPKMAAALLGAAWAALQAGEPEAALALVDKARSYAEDAEWQDRADAACLDLLAYILAQSPVAAVRTRVPDFPAMVRLAFAYEAAGRPADASVLWAEMLKQKPLDPRAPMWDWNVLRAAPPGQGTAGVMRIVGRYNSSSAWWSANSEESRGRVRELAARMFPYRAEMYGR
jgi:tetratricopeptide (TPR) repeat protein